MLCSKDKITTQILWISLKSDFWLFTFWSKNNYFSLVSVQLEKVKVHPYNELLNLPFGWVQSRMVILYSKAECQLHKNGS